MSGSDSDESVDQLEKLQHANVRPGMFVSGWEDPNDEVFEEKNPRGKNIIRSIILNGTYAFLHDKYILN